MAEPAVLSLLVPDAPLDAARIEANLNILVRVLNALGRRASFEVPDFLPGVVVDGASYRVSGTLLCESLVIEGQRPVVAEDRLATPSRTGLLLQGPAVAAVGTLPDEPAAALALLAEKIEELLGALRASGQMAEG